MPPANRLLKPGDRLPPYSFGVAGVDTWDELESAPGSLGIVRDVRSDQEGGSVGGVSYEFESLKVDLGCRWRRTQTAGRWELDLKTSRDPLSLTSYSSLEQLSQRIRERYRKTGRLPQDDDELLTLDKVLVSTVTKVSELHSVGQVIGLLTPVNVISFFDEKRDLRVLLPDAGFRWRGAPPGPPWLEHLEQQWSELWHPKAGDIFQLREWSKDAARADVQLLARLCLWVLTGSISNADQTVREHFVAGAKGDTEVRPATCWQILYQTLASESELKPNGLKPIATVAEFADKIRHAPLSDHFRQRRRVVGKGIPWKSVAIVAIIFTILSGVGYVVSHPDLLQKVISGIVPPVAPPNRLCPDCKHPSALLPILDEYSPIQRELESSLAALKTAPSQSHDRALLQAIERLESMRELLTRMRTAMENSAGNRGTEQACVDKLDDLLGQSIQQLGEAFIESARVGNVVEQREIGRRIVDSFDQWQGQSASEKKEIPAWHEIIGFTLLGN